MKTWLRRLRGAIGIGLTWAVGWATFGVLVGVLSVLVPGPLWDAVFKIFDAPLPALAVPGFVGGTLFSLVLGVAARRRRFDELSLPGFTALGAVGGTLVALIPAAVVAVGLGSLNGTTAGLWQLTATVAGPLALLGAASAAGSLLLARKAEQRAMLDAGEGLAELGLTDAEKRELLGKGD